MDIFSVWGKKRGGGVKNKEGKIKSSEGVLGGRNRGEKSYRKEGKGKKLQEEDY